MKQTKKEYEKNFRANFKLIKEVENNPIWIERFNYVAQGNKLSQVEMNQIGLVLERIK